MELFSLETFADNISEYPHYHITPDGQLFSRKSLNGVGLSKMWKKCIGADRKGYKIYLLRDKNGKRQTVLGHRLVAMVYIGSIPANMMVCHNDGNPSNNHFSNLRIDTAKSNQMDRAKHGTKIQGEDVNTNILSKEQVYEIYELAAAGILNVAIAKKFNVKPSAIDYIFQRKNWKHLDIPSELVEAANKNRTHRQKSTIKKEDIVPIFQKRKDGTPVSKIAKDYGANDATIYAILNRKNWRHVQIPEEFLS